MQHYLDLATDIHFWISATGVGAILWFIANFWIPPLLKHALDARLEREKRKTAFRDKGGIIAELYSLQENEANAPKINKCIFELCLYLPPCLIHKMAHTLKKDGHELDVGRPALFLQIREFIEGKYKADKSKVLDEGNIPYLNIENK